MVRGMPTAEYSIKGSNTGIPVRGSQTPKSQIVNKLELITASMRRRGGYVETEVLGQPDKKRREVTRTKAEYVPEKWPQSKNGEQAKGAKNRYASTTRGRACMH